MCQIRRVPARSRFFFYRLLSAWLLLTAPALLCAQTPEPGAEENAGTGEAVEEEAPSDAPLRLLSGNTNVRFSGFGTVGFVYTDSKHLSFARRNVSPLKKERFSFGPDSVLGVQGDVYIDPQLSATLQVISRENPRGSYEPSVRLAFVKYAATDNLSIRVGRIHTPLFMFSESSYINYALPWIRPPTETYSTLPYSAVDGIDMLYRIHLGGTDIEIHPYFGNSILIENPAVKNRVRNGWGLITSAAKGPLTVFAAYSKSHFSLKFRGDAYESLSSVLSTLPYGHAILDDLSGSRGSGDVSSIGFHLDGNRWLLAGEYNRVRARRYAYSIHAWFVTLGYHFGSLTPYLTVARHSVDRPLLTESTGIPAIDATLQGFTIPFNFAQHGNTAGLRWDFYRSAALKLEFSRTHIAKRAWGSFYYDQPNQAPDKRKVNTLSMSVDFIF